ncbi:hypothetical protein ANO11243_017850 [Dothideomycetidae sp. 11243]|nr:hypothetical protein ANO11243_017850 [fungal sp. No.11243]
MIVPLLLVGAWATFITVFSRHVHPLGVNSILLTITGFVVALGLSFRSATAYERYAEGRRLWGQLTLTCQTLARVIWIHAVEREESVTDDVLGKLTAMNLLVAFAVALKHKLRFEPYTNYDDLDHLIQHLDTFARSATNDHVYKNKPPNMFKVVGEHLGISFATSNPRKVIKRATEPLGNLPLEILCYLSAFIDDLATDGRLPVPMQQTTAYNALSALNDVLVNTERVLNTPLPIAYAIAIAQITWVYVILLPFQLYNTLKWITIPATLAAAYIILGLLFIGREVENPFGNDVNDLPLDLFCLQIVQDLETITSKPKPKVAQFVRSENNKVFFPMSESPYTKWAARPEGAIRNALRNRPYAAYGKPKTTITRPEV